eukprot:gene7898-40672_t
MKERAKCPKLVKFQVAAGYKFDQAALWNTPLGWFLMHRGDPGKRLQKRCRDKDARYKQLITNFAKKPAVDWCHTCLSLEGESSPFSLLESEPDPIAQLGDRVAMSADDVLAAAKSRVGGGFALTSELERLFDKVMVLEEAIAVIDDALARDLPVYELQRRLTYLLQNAVTVSPGLQLMECAVGGADGLEQLLDSARTMEHWWEFVVNRVVRITAADLVGFRRDGQGPVIYGPWCCSAGKGGCGAFGHPKGQCPGRNKVAYFWRSANRNNMSQPSVWAQSNMDWLRGSPGDFEYWAPRNPPLPHTPPPMGPPPTAPRGPLTRRAGRPTPTSIRAPQPPRRWASCKRGVCAVSSCVGPRGSRWEKASIAGERAPPEARGVLQLVYGKESEKGGAPGTQGDRHGPLTAG